MMTRRTFTTTLAAGAGALPLIAAKRRKLKIGYTCITWGSFPRAPETLEPAMKDISSLGFYSFETFPEILDYWDDKDTLRGMIQRYSLPLKSGYISTNLIDPSLKDQELARIKRLGQTIKKYGGTFAVLASNGVKRDSYDFQAHRANIIASLNDACMALNDLGLAAGLHQHTGTAIESRDEVYDVMHAVNTKHVKFAPDVGQLQKGGADAAKVVEDFLPIVAHMHLKDYKGWDHYAGYCPLGEGKVDIVRILDLVEDGGRNPDIMVELDPSKGQPQTPLETAQTSKAYLEKLGYKFRT
ncbi:MAG TPA: TIM barrel protein [Bryobacteraceae bacterium]